MGINRFRKCVYLKKYMKKVAGETLIVETDEQISEAFVLQH